MPIEVKFLFFTSESGHVELQPTKINDTCNVPAYLSSSIGYEPRKVPKEKVCCQKHVGMLENFLTHSRLTLNQDKIGQAYKLTNSTLIHQPISYMNSRQCWEKSECLKCQGNVLHELIRSCSQPHEIVCTWCAHMCRKKSRIVENITRRRTICLGTEHFYNQFQHFVLPI